MSLPKLEQHRQGNSKLTALTLLLLCAIVLLAFILRVYRVTAPSLWFDESFSWAITRFPSPELIDRIAQDNNPPLYFLTLQTWIRIFGDSVYSMRGLSVLGGCATVLGVYLFARQAYCKGSDAAQANSPITDAQRIAILAAFFVALSAGHIVWSREIRGYSLGTALAALSAWLLFRALASPRQLSLWSAFGLTNLAFVYTHYYAMFSVVAQAVFLASFCIRNRFENPKERGQVFQGASVAFAINVCGLLPWLPVLLRQRAQVQADFWTGPLSIDQFTYAVNDLLFGKYYGLGEIVPPLVALAHIAVILSLLWRPRLADLYVFSAIVIPIILAALTTVLDTKIITPRYFLFAHLFFLVALSRLVCRVSDTLIRRSIIAILGVNALGIFWGYLAGLNLDDRPGGRGAMAYLDEHRLEGEPVITCSPLLHYSLLYYTGDRNGWYIYDHPDYPMAHYRGKPLVRVSELITPEGMVRLDRQYAWVADMSSNWTHGRVQVPMNWTEVTQERFPEVYWIQGTTMLTKYRVNAIQPDSPSLGSRDPDGIPPVEK